MRIYSLGYIGLVRSVDSFDVSKGIMFSTYAAKFILTEIRHELRKYRVFESLNVKKEEIELIDLIPSYTNIESEYEDKETVQELITSLKILNEKQLKIIMLFYGIGCEQKNEYQITEIIGHGQPYVTKILKKSRLKIQKSLIKSY